MREIKIVKEILAFILNNYQTNIQFFASNAQSTNFIGYSNYKVLVSSKSDKNKRESFSLEIQKYFFFSKVY